MRVAYFTPLHPRPGGISDHSEELLPHLAAFAEIDIVIDGDYTPVNPAIRDGFRILHHREYLRDPSAYEAAVYQLGNNLRCHGYMVPCLRAAPGIVVLQDYCLQYLVLGLTLRRGEFGALVEALQPVYGERAARLTRRLLLGLEDPGLLTFAHPLLAASRGVIVHSQHALELVKREVPGKPVRNVPMGVSMPPRQHSKEELRRRYGYRADDFIVASVSTRAPKKRLDLVLASLGELRGQIPGLLFLVVGGGSPGASTHRMIQDLGLSDIVEQTGWVDPERYEHLLRLADVAVDLRETTAAETANSALRCLAAGTPVIVSARGTFLELPEDCCPRIVPDDHAAQALRGLLLELALHRDRVQAMSVAALDYARKHLTLDLQAHAFMGFIEAVVKTTAGSGLVSLLEPRTGLARPVLAGVYNLCRTASLVRSYGVGDSLKRLCVGLTARLKRAGFEAL